MFGVAGIRVVLLAVGVRDRVKALSTEKGWGTGHKQGSAEGTVGVWNCVCFVRKRVQPGKSLRWLWTTLRRHRKVRPSGFVIRQRFPKWCDVRARPLSCRHQRKPPEGAGGRNRGLGQGPQESS